MDLLVAFHKVRNAGIDAVLAFLGSGEQETDLKEYVRQQQLPDVHFFGFRNQSDLPKFYSAADVFVLPSENEPWGLVINEVMCAGLPVIASNEIGSVDDLVRHGENGFTYNAGDVDTLTEYLSKLLQEPEMRARMGEASRRIIAEWDYDHCVLGIKQALARNGPDSSSVVESQAA
jgi:glycosyltransferase involved in cell wall biosynthesis